MKRKGGLDVQTLFEQECSSTLAGMRVRKYDSRSYFLARNEALTPHKYFGGLI